MRGLVGVSRQGRDTVSVFVFQVSIGEGGMARLSIRTFEGPEPGCTLECVGNRGSGAVAEGAHTSFGINAQVTTSLSPIHGSEHGWMKRTAGLRLARRMMSV